MCNQKINTMPTGTATYATSYSVRLELTDDKRDICTNSVFFGNDSLKLGVDLIRAYFAHCFYWLREKITPFSSK